MSSARSLGPFVRLFDGYGPLIFIIYLRAHRNLASDSVEFKGVVYGCVFGEIDHIKITNESEK